MLGKAATWLLYLSLGLVMVVHDAAWPLCHLLGRIRAGGRLARALRAQGAKGDR